MCQQFVLNAKKAMLKLMGIVSHVVEDVKLVQNKMVN